MRIQRSLKLWVGVLGSLVAVAVGLLVLGLAGVMLHDRSSGSVGTEGSEREYLLHVPEGHDPDRPVPLVVSFHGAGMWPAVHRYISGWSQVADEHGFLVAYPAGSGFPRVWPPVEPQVEADVRFVSRLLDELSTLYHIDPSRIYVDGLSNGGGMAFALSCRLPHRIAAVGTVAAAHALSWEWCGDPPPMPLISFHGTDDPMVPYEGAAPRPPFVPTPLPDIPSWTARWAHRNHCEPEPDETTVATDVVRSAYSECEEGAEVVLYTILGGGHTWPGGVPLPALVAGETTESIEATRLMWDFFRRHRLGGRAADGP